GVIGGDVRGSVVGAAGGLLGCCLTQVGGAGAIPPQGLSLIVVFGALVGATGFLFMRFWLWKYGMIFRAIGWLFGLAPISDKAGSLAGHFLVPRRPAGFRSRTGPHRRPGDCDEYGLLTRRTIASMRRDRRSAEEYVKFRSTSSPKAGSSCKPAVLTTDTSRSSRLGLRPSLDQSDDTE